MLPTALHGSPGKSHPPSTSLVNAEVTTAAVSGWGHTTGHIFQHMQDAHP